MENEFYFEYSEEKSDPVSEIQEAREISYNNLKSCYPWASETQLLEFQNIIKTHAQEKLPMTPEMEQYIKWDKHEKIAKEYKDSYRKKILKQSLLLDHPIEGIKFSKIKVRPLDDEKTYNWVASFVDKEVLEKITLKTIDYTKMEKLYLKGEISYNLEDLPEDLRDLREQQRITIERNKNEVQS